MAIFYLQITSVQRSAGRRATASAAYRAGERVRDERTHEVHNFTHRKDVLHTEILLPNHFETTAMDWARNRERLWNAAEHAEKRYNSRVAREYQVTLPSELDAPQRLQLARTFAREISERYNVAVDLAVHAPRAGSDPRHFHAHLLTTTREVTPTGLGAKTGLDMHAVERRRRALPDHRQEFINLRARWAGLTNQALEAAHSDARVDHRSLAAQGIDREPLPRIPLMQLKMEQRGIRSELAERLRAEYRERVQQRLQRAEQAHKAPAASRTAPEATTAPAQGGDVETLRRQAREAWLQLRAREAGSTVPTATHERERVAEAAHPAASAAGDDLAL
jgi:hypothetical protein